MVGFSPVFIISWNKTASKKIQLREFILKHLWRTSCCGMLRGWRQDNTLWNGQKTLSQYRHPSFFLVSPCWWILPVRSSLSPGQCTEHRILKLYYSHARQSACNEVILLLEQSVHFGVYSTGILTFPFFLSSPSLIYHPSTVLFLLNKIFVITKPQ